MLLITIHSRTVIDDRKNCDANYRRNST